VPGIPTQFRILEKTILKLAGSSDPKLQKIAKVMRDNAAFAHLGALGPALGDFLPADPPPRGTQDPPSYALVWKMFFGLVGGQPGLLSSLTLMRDTLNQLQTIVDNEDTAALCNLKDTDFLQKMNDAAKDFEKLVSNLEPQALAIANVITSLQSPIHTDPAPNPASWQMRDFLAWKSPGKFIDALLKTAKDSGDERLLAYAYGYICSYSGNVCGNPFIASSVGGPARTQWWRRRFVENFVDAWVHGYYEAGASMSGDTPTPAYDTWPDLCGTNLHQKIELGTIDPVELLDTVKKAKPFPVVLPQDFAEHWYSAFQHAYGAGAAAGRFTADSLNASYVMTWLVLWFQTSGVVFGCRPVTPVTPPDGCGDSPGELDPFVPAPDGGPSLPPEPQVDYDVDVGAVICGILLAIFGGVSLLAGNIAAGAGFIAGAIDEFDCDSLADFHWKELRCQLFWYRMYLFNGLKGIHQFLKFAGLEFPFTDSLAKDDDVLKLLGVDYPFESGKTIVKSRKSREDFPSKPWSATLLTFNARPTSADPGFESPRSIPCSSEVYPSFFVDDDGSNPLSNGDVKTTGTFPVRHASSGDPIQFGNAVANAVDLFANLGKFPSWNLDGDRGLAHLTWQLEGAYNPDNVKIDPEP
jgi:hypothetical protein